MSYILYAWLTSFTYGLGSVVGKISTKHQITNPWHYNFVWAVLTIISILPFAIMGHVGLPQDWGSMLWLGVANAVSGLLFILAFFAVDLSILSPLAMLRTPLLALSGALIFGEKLTVVQWALIGVVFLAGILVNLDEKFSIKSVLNRNILLAFAWILSSVWFNSMIKYASLTNGFWEVSLWPAVIAVIIYLPTLPLFYKELIRTKPVHHVGIMITTMLYTAGLLFSIKAFGENIGISIAIISLPLAMLMTMVIAKFAPHILEKHTGKVYAIRLVAAAVMFVAALGLST